MNYKVNEIFESIQGEGSMSGELAVFVRFSGCNMRCSFCDTDFEAYKEMTAENIFLKCNRFKSRNIIFTGGEPTLQLTNELIELFLFKDWHISIETNGIRPVMWGVHHISVSPKDFNNWNQKHGQDIKVLVDKDNMPDLEGILRTTVFNNYFLQPVDGKNLKENTKICVQEIHKNPKWKLSLQIHKIINVK